MVVAIYARVSTKEKGVCLVCRKVIRTTDEKLVDHDNRAGDKCAGSGAVVVNHAGQDTENQLRELRQFIAASGWTCIREYVDYVTGSGKKERVQFDAMLKDAAKHKFKAIVVWALDRFTREGILPTFEYIRNLTREGVGFVSYSEPQFRTTGAMGELMLALAAWIAEQERKRISDRTKAGLQTTRLRGTTLGRPPKQVDTARIQELHAAGAGALKIAMIFAKEGKVVSRETVRRILRDKRKRGRLSIS